MLLKGNMLLIDNMLLTTNSDHYVQNIIRQWGASIERAGAITPHKLSRTRTAKAGINVSFENIMTALVIFAVPYAM